LELDLILNQLGLEGPSVFHEGEREMQQITKTRLAQEELGRGIIREFMPEQHRQFFTSIGANPLLFAGTLDERGQPWASILLGNLYTSYPLR
jgi:3-oxoacyl-[acyl-carrier-protein] synthase III